MTHIMCDVQGGCGCCSCLVSCYTIKSLQISAFSWIIPLLVWVLFAHACRNVVYMTLQHSLPRTPSWNFSLLSLVSDNGSFNILPIGVKCYRRVLSGWPAAELKNERFVFIEAFDCTINFLRSNKYESVCCFSTLAHDSSKMYTGTMSHTQRQVDIFYLHCFNLQMAKIKWKFARTL